MFKQYFYCEKMTRQTTNQGYIALPTLSHTSASFYIRVFLLLVGENPHLPTDVYEILLWLLTSSLDEHYFVNYVSLIEPNIHLSSTSPSEILHKVRLNHLENQSKLYLYGDSSRNNSDNKGNSTFLN